MHLLPEEVEKVEGAANFRQVDKNFTEDNVDLINFATKKRMRGLVM